MAADAPPRMEVVGGAGVAAGAPKRPPPGLGAFALFPPRTDVAEPNRPPEGWAGGCCVALFWLVLGAEPNKPPPVEGAAPGAAEVPNGDGLLPKRPDMVCSCAICRRRPGGE